MTGMTITLILLLSAFVLSSCSGGRAVIEETWTVVRLVQSGEETRVVPMIVEVSSCTELENKTVNCSAGTGNQISAGISGEFGVNLGLLSTLQSSIISAFEAHRSTGETLTLEPAPAGFVNRYVIEKKYTVINGEAAARSANGTEIETTFSFDAACSMRILSKEQVECEPQTLTDAYTVSPLRTGTNTTRLAPTSKPVATMTLLPTIVVKDSATPHPTLSDLRVRQAIAHCLDRTSLITSVYPYIEDMTSFMMDSFLPKSHWAYGGPYSDFPRYDPGKGKRLLEQAGWTLPQDSTVRINTQGEPLAIKFTTTTAQYRQTWSAVMKQNLEDCGFQILTNYVPASWWFGESTGLARRDFELGAFAWVAQTDPAGRTLYACDQIPLPSNNWEGQNYVSWCNPTASAAIIKATSSPIRNERIAAYNIVQEEFARDVVSIPIFQRAEVEAWRSNLQGVRPDPTEYATANLHEWRLSDSRDTITIGMTLEPDSMWSLVSTVSTQPLVDRPAKGVIYSQYGYDYQPVLQTDLSTIESGLATNDLVEVRTGDIVYIYGRPVKLEKGVKIIDADGNETVYSGSGTINMRRMVVTYRLNDYTWSDGVTGSVDDMRLGFRIDCDRTTGGKVDSYTCDAIDSTSFASSVNEVEVTYLPGYQDPEYFLYPFNIYPSHQVLHDGRRLESVPASDWATLSEIVETPLSFGPYYIDNWDKGRSITLVRNPYYAFGVTTPNIVFRLLGDANQAVTQLINGGVDYLDKSTLGTGVEVLTVKDAAKSTGNIEYRISASPTWEHIDINLSTK